LAPPAAGASGGRPPRGPPRRGSSPPWGRGGRRGPAPPVGGGGTGLFLGPPGRGRLKDGGGNRSAAVPPRPRVRAAGAGAGRGGVRARRSPRGDGGSPPGASFKAPKDRLAAARKAGRVPAVNDTAPRARKDTGTDDRTKTVPSRKSAATAGK